MFQISSLVLLLVRGVPMLNICVLVERTSPFGTQACPSVQIFVGILISIADVRDRRIRMGNALTMGMNISSLNYTFFGYSMSRRKSEVTRVKVSAILGLFPK
jgi:hypothetical protein